MEVRVLGPVDVVVDGVPVALGGRRPKTIVAVLALRAGRTVPIERLVDEVWGEAPPRSAVDTLQSYLSRLRTAFARVGVGDRLVTHGSSYELRPDTVDAAAFVADVERGRRAAREHQPAAAAAAFRAGLARWHGRVVEELVPGEASAAGMGPLLGAEVARLEDLRLAALGERIEAELALGAHSELAGELAALVREHPLRESLHAQRVRALAAAGRQGDALAAYSEARVALVEGLGIEPGTELRALQQRVLEQDPTLAAPSAAEGPVDPHEATSLAPWEERWSSREVPAGDGRTGEPSATDRPLGNLPLPLGGFVGRREERGELAALLSSERLVTLTGAGGCGKTRLALRVASDLAPRFPGGVWLVELGSHVEPRLVTRAVAEVFGVPDGGPDDLALRIARRLGTHPTLLVLDNCEHLVDACAELASELLAACPALSLLATSREPLDITGERTSRVPSLALPPREVRDADDLRESEAAQLFVARACEADPSFEMDDERAATVARVCRELDGIPLALELAAARLRVLSLEELADRLGDRFRLLRHGRRSAPPRHRTLEAAIDWSHDLLERPQQRLLARLSVFAGGFTLDAVEAVCAGHGVDEADVLDHLAALIDKSLVQPVRAAGPARHDLFATVRTYARARLGGPDAAADPDVARLEARHAEFFAGLAERAAPALTGADQVAWFNRLHVEHDNLRAVLARGGGPQGDDTAARVAASCWRFWLQFGHVAEGQRWLAAALDDPSSPPWVRARLLLGAGRIAGARGEHVRSAERLAAARDTAAGAGDGALEATGSARLAVAVAESSGSGVGRGPIAAPASQGRGVDVTSPLDHLAAAEATLARVADVLAADEAPGVAAEIEEARGLVAWREGRLGDAATAFARAERAHRDGGDEWSGCLARLGAARVARGQGDPETALRLHRENLVRSLRLTVSSLDFVGLPQDLHGLAAIAARADSHELAAELLGAAATLHTAVELPLTATERAEQSHTLTEVRRWLGASAADAAYARGRCMAVESAVRDALERTAALLPVPMGVGAADSGR
ncbi:helix-turn-helix domain-containing protein [Egibacter rhizosphaerae]|uniref:Helix-turn-helix domain-containing protein n=1 Tax=Egibacter rhizosphaerae TaxID=1670831 RepID=A0A411YI77_9ACTN|nr:BTAD domain-containing putative transcriptional regulator [Egibacter rhizosphaerae]QBI20978.1 helix-turn-helix domain-containing protein [Egibacter rhizosphaerae]